MAGWHQRKGGGGRLLPVPDLSNLGRTNELPELVPPTLADRALWCRLVADLVGLYSYTMSQRPPTLGEAGTDAAEGSLPQLIDRILHLSDRSPAGWLTLK